MLFIGLCFFFHRVKRCRALLPEEVWVQWPVLAMFALGVGLVHSVKDIVVWDYFHLRLLDPERLGGFLDAAEHCGGFSLSGEEKEALRLTPLLRVLALLAPIAGVVGFFLISYQVWSFLHARKREKERHHNAMLRGMVELEVGARVKVTGGDRAGALAQIHLHDPSDEMHEFQVQYEQDGARNWHRRQDLELYVERVNPWEPTEAEDLTLLLIVMPAVFIVMALYAEIRAIQMISGTSLQASDCWEDFQVWRLCTYTEDLESAAAIQYLTVLAFALLCSHFFGLEYLTAKVEQGEKELILEINRLRTELGKPPRELASDLGPPLAEADAEHRSTLLWSGLQGIWAYILVGTVRCILGLFLAVMTELSFPRALYLKVTRFIEPVFFFTAALCVYNWVNILRIREIMHPRALGPKATMRFVAVRILLLLVDGQKSFLAMLSNQHRMHLYHVVLLVFECLGVAVWNFFAWYERVNVGIRGMSYYHKLPGGETPRTRDVRP